MISGVVILQDVRKRTILKFLKRQIPKVLIPLIFWSFFYELWVVRFNYHTFSFKNTLLKLLQGNAYYHLWFLFMILGLYLMVPILKVFIQNAESNNILYFLILWFIISSLMGLLNKFSGFRTMLNLPFMTGYIGYFVLGCYLAKIRISKSSTFVLYFLALSGIAVTIIGTYMLTVKNNGLYDGYFYDYLSPNIVITSIGIFLFIKNSCSKVAHFNKKLSKLIAHLSKMVFGIFLVHILVIDALATNMLGFKMSYMTLNPIISIPLTDCIVLLVSYIIVSLLNKIPLIKGIVP
jgi:surface polysaccharide O-acyltransferase-like enzyme